MQYVRERKECSETYREAEIDRDSERGRERERCCERRTKERQR